MKGTLSSRDYDDLGGRRTQVLFTNPSTISWGRDSLSGGFSVRLNLITVVAILLAIWPLEQAFYYANRVFNDPGVTGAPQQSVLATVAIYYVLLAGIILIASTVLRIEYTIPSKPKEIPEHA